MEYAMKFAITSTALGLVLAAGAPLAHAQTILGQGPMVTVPAATVMSQPMETVQTTETVRTLRPAPAPTARRRIVTTRPITSETVPPPTVVSRSTPAVRPPV